MQTKRQKGKNQQTKSNLLSKKHVALGFNNKWHRFCKGYNKSTSILLKLQAKRKKCKAQEAERTEQKLRAKIKNQKEGSERHVAPGVYNHNVVLLASLYCLLYLK